MLKIHCFVQSLYSGFKDLFVGCFFFLVIYIMQPLLVSKAVKQGNPGGLDYVNNYWFGNTFSVLSLSNSRKCIWKVKKEKKKDFSLHRVIEMQATKHFKSSRFAHRCDLDQTKSDIGLTSSL